MTSRPRRIGLLVATLPLVALPCLARARAASDPARPFELRDLPDATAAFRAILHDPLAVEPREKLAAVYEREGFRSAAAFYAATARSLHERKVTPGERLPGESWRCPVVEVGHLPDRIARDADDGKSFDLAMAASLAHDFYDSNQHACEAALLWAWYRNLWNRPIPDLQARELAIRTLITAAEDGLPRAQPDFPADFEIYQNVALDFAGLGDPVSAAVAARRAEIVGRSTNFEVSESSLWMLRDLERNAFEPPARPPTP